MILGIVIGAAGVIGFLFVAQWYAERYGQAAESVDVPPENLDLGSAS